MTMFFYESQQGAGASFFFLLGDIWVRFFFSFGCRVLLSEHELELRYAFLIMVTARLLSLRFGHILCMVCTTPLRELGCKMGR